MDDSRKLGSSSVREFLNEQKRSLDYQQKVYKNSLDSVESDGDFQAEVSRLTAKSR